MEALRLRISSLAGSCSLEALFGRCVGLEATRTTVVPAGCRLSKVSNLREDGVRVTTALNRLLALQGARVIDVLFA